MLKQIHVEDLRVGMYVEELCGSWMEHPFWTTRLRIDDAADLERVRASGIREVWIDTSKGADLPADTPLPPVTRADADTAIDAALGGIVDTQGPPPRVPFDEELVRAAGVLQCSRAAVISMFEEARMGRAVDADRAAGLAEEIGLSVARNPAALISLARLRRADDYTYMHSVAVCALMTALAQQLGLGPEQVRSAGLSGLLHDLGKSQIPLQILNKPGRLTDAEFAAIKRHPEVGHRLLQDMQQPDDVVLDVCLHHHEKVDGSGYPHRLAGDAISRFAKMGAVCDVYDAITSDRPYKRGWDPAEAIRKMAEWNAGHFDEEVFHAFVRTVGIYPVGSLVRMESGRLAVVVEHNEGRLLTPTVRVFFSVKSNVRIRPELIDLSDSMTRDRIVARESPQRWGFRDLFSLWQSDSGQSGR